MALTIALMAVFSLILAIRDYKKLYSLLFALMTAAISMSLLTVMVEINRNSNYRISSSSPFAILESRLFQLMTRSITISLSNLLIIKNLGVVIYLSAVMLLAVSFSKALKTSEASSGGERLGISVVWIRKLLPGVSFLLYLVLYFTLYHPATSYSLYLFAYYVNDATRAHLIKLMQIVDAFMSFFAFVCLAYPIFFLLVNYFRNNFTFFSEQLLGLAVTLALLNIFFFFTFFSGVFSKDVPALFLTSFWYSIRIHTVPAYYSTGMPMLSLALLTAVFFILTRFQVANLVYIFRGYALRSSLRALYVNTRDLLHSEKNVMFNVNILARDALDAYGTEPGRQALERILGLSGSHLSSISRALDASRSIRLKMAGRNLIDAVEAAIEDSTLPPDITVTRKYPVDPVICNYDYYYMSTAISNLLVNSVEALRTSGCPNPRIDIVVDISESWVCLSLRDNGIGILPGNMRKIYRPSFSTKSKHNNFGIGLSYVLTVVKSHFGHIRIKSRSGEYTLVEILLSRSKP